MTSEIVTYIIASATGIQAIALIWTVIVMIRTTRRQLRAYVFIDSMAVKNISVNQNPKTLVIIKNSGLTPAYNLSGMVGIDFREYPLASNLDPLPIDPSIKSSIPPGGRINFNLTHNELLTSARIDQLNNGTHAIYVTGRIIYIDAFGKRRFTKFLTFHNRFTTGNLITLTPYSEGNEAN